MIKVEKPLQINEIKKIPFIKYIVVAEVVIGIFILFFTMIIIYYKIVKPIMYLQKDIDRFDEIGWLKNNFVELTENLEEESK